MLYRLASTDIPHVTPELERADASRSTTANHDPLTGTWQHDASRARLSVPVPRSWTLRIVASAEYVEVRQDAVRADGTSVTVQLAAPCDGRTHAVTGSAVVDQIVYTRLDASTLLGVGERDGEVTLKTTFEVSGDGRELVLDYTIYERGAVASNGTAVFERAG